MANSKISALTSATTPLAGTETLPVVQSSTTKNVSVSNLTAGRSVTASNFIPSSSTVPTNGMYLPAANAIGLSTNTTQAFNIDSSQRVGIGTVTNRVGEKLHVLGYGIVTSSAENTNIAYFGTLGTSTQYIGTFNNIPVVFRTNNTDQATLSTAGDLTLNTGNLVVTNGKGIDFSATPGTGTSELLADYEEGTWTPFVSSTGGSGVITTYTASGTYTKIGRLVTATARITTANIGTAAGAINVSAIPFTAASTNSFTVAGNENAIVGYVISGNASSTTAFNFAKYDGNSPLANGAAFTLAITYLV